MSTHDQESHPVHVVTDRFTDFLAGLRQFEQSCSRHIGLSEYFDQFLPEIEVPHVFGDYRFLEIRVGNLLMDESHVGLRFEVAGFEIRLQLDDPFLYVHMSTTRKFFHFAPHVDSFLTLSCLPN